jgi:hypothetical protein
MRSSTAFRSLAGAALICAFAPLSGAAQLNCNLGTAFDPIWVACQGAFTQIAGTNPEALQDYLDLMKDKDNWKLYPTSPDQDKFEEAFNVVTTWDLSDDPSPFIGRTNFNDDGTPQNGAHGPFTGFNPATQTLNFLSPYTGIFVVVLKGGPWFSMYLFNIDFAITALQFDMSGTFEGGEDALSHADLWGGTETTVPEPSSMLLLASGLLGLGFVGYRRRRK